MTSHNHPTGNDTNIDQNPATASQPQKNSTRSLADDLGAHPVTDAKPSKDERPITPGTYLISRFPALAEKYGAPLVETYTGSDEDDLRLIIKAGEDAFFAASLGMEGSADAPVVYDQSTGKFFKYSKGRYCETTAEVLSDEVRRLLLAAERACTDLRLDRAGLVKLRGQRWLNPVMQAAKGILSVRDAFWAPPPGMIPCRNGVLDWSDDDDDDALILKPHSPDYHFRGLLGVDYDPKAQCPRFMELLNRALPPDDVELLQRILGSLLYGRNLAQKLVILMGTPQSGKGVIARIVIILLGPENVTTLRTKTLDSRFEIGRFVNKLLLYAPDVSERFLHESGAHLLKAITGEDPFSAEYKNSNVTPPAKPLRTGILITCNSRLKIHLEGDRGAWERRLIVIPFDREGVTEQRQITGFSEALVSEEGAGILNFALEGLKRFIQDDFKLPLNTRQRAVVNDLLSESESYTCFIRECIERDSASDLMVSRAYPAYVRFCSTRGWPPLSERKFEQSFKAEIQSLFGITQRHDLRDGGRSARGWSGIRLNDDFGTPDVE